MKIYVSSTFEDLKEYRRAVYDQLRQLRFDAVAMEDYVAGERRPLAQCIDDVAQADIYLGIFAWRYGYVPNQDAGNRQSITECEYRAAGNSQKERLIFLLAPDAPWPPKLMDAQVGDGEQGKRIQALREELAERHVVSFFSTPDDLAKKVSAALQTVFARRVARAPDPDAGAQPPVPAQAPWQALGNRTGMLVTAAWFLAGLEAARNVGMVENLAGHRVASAFLVRGVDLHARFGNDLCLVVPAHVINESGQWGGSDPAQCQLRLSFPEASEERVELTTIAWSSPVDEWDCSIVRLASQPAGRSGLGIAKALPPPPQGERLTSPWNGGRSMRLALLGHPLAGPLSFSLDARLLECNDRALHYAAETSAGSSGSPVFDSVWRVIGMHRRRGDLPSLSGAGLVEACEAASLPGLVQALKAEFG